MHYSGVQAVAEPPGAWIAEYWSQMQPSADDPVPELVRLLAGPLPQQRCRAARALGRLGPLAADAVPKLRSATDDGEPTVREAAAQALGQMGSAALADLLALLRHTDKYVRRHAVWAIGKIGVASTTVVTALVGALKDPDARTATGAAEALGKLGPAAAPAVPALAEAMRGTNIVLCRLAAKALSQVGASALPTLVSHLRHRDPFVRAEAALALGWMGAAAEPAVPELVDLLHRTAPAMSASRPAPSCPNTMTPVTSVLPAPSPAATGDDTGRAHAAQALGRIGPAAAAGIPELERAAHDRHEATRTNALTALRLIRGY